MTTMKTVSATAVCRFLLFCWFLAVATTPCIASQQLRGGPSSLWSSLVESLTGPAKSSSMDDDSYKNLLHCLVHSNGPSDDDCTSNDLGCVWCNSVDDDDDVEDDYSLWGDDSLWDDDATPTGSNRLCVTSESTDFISASGNYDCSSHSNDDDDSVTPDDDDAFGPDLMACLAQPKSDCETFHPADGTSCVWCEAKPQQGICVSAEAAPQIDGYIFHCDTPSTTTTTSSSSSSSSSSSTIELN